jgi:hypothetical protein
MTTSAFIARARDLLAAAKARLAPTAEADPSLVERLNALEAMVEGLQDAVDRESQRHDARLEELARRLEPSALTKALSEDARRRGL